MKIICHYLEDSVLGNSAERRDREAAIDGEDAGAVFEVRVGCPFIA
jgi:hypothetical protein